MKERVVGHSYIKSEKPSNRPIAGGNNGKCETCHRFRPVEGKPNTFMCLDEEHEWTVDKKQIKELCLDKALHRREARKRGCSGWISKSWTVR